MTHVIHAYLCPVSLGNVSLGANDVLAVIAKMGRIGCVCPRLGIGGGDAPDLGHDRAGPKGPGLPVLLCGDLNDTVQAATTQLLLGPPGSEIDTRGFKTPDKGDVQRLWNLAPLMPAGRNYSRINEGRPELIDHILVSEVLVKKVDVTSVGAVLAEPLPSITSNPTLRLNQPSSDHAPVAATFLI